MRVKRVVYYNAGRVEDESKLYHVGLVIGYSLLLSNSIRRDTLVVVDMSYRGIATRLWVKSWRVRNLRLDASSLWGFMKRALTGRIRGVEVSEPNRPIQVDTCIYVMASVSAYSDTIVFNLCPPLRRLKSIGVVLSEGRINCRYGVTCALNLDRVWLKAGVVQLMLDRWLEDAAHL